MLLLALATACFGLLLTSCRSAGPPQQHPGSSPDGTQATAAPPTASSTLSLSPAPLPAGPAGTSAFSATVLPIAAERLTHSWRKGCPVAIKDLRLLSVKHWGFDDRSHHGEMVIHRDQASNLLAIMRELYELRFPIEKMQLVDKYEGNDERSMEANNTSAFNCRDIAGRSGAWSEHAYGRAVDINPVQNPYVAASGKVSPPSGTPYAQRSQQAKGIIHATGPVVRAFQSRGWKWGGNWSSSKDYQHFSVTGR